MSGKLYSYEEFDLDAVLDGRERRSNTESFKLPGTENIKRIYDSKSTSSEEFVIGAVESLGQANRNLMFANMSIEGFDDRLKLAARVAKNVKIAQDRGLEGFENVTPLNPIVYALEAEKGESAGAKIGGFFKKIANAIVNAARHIITMIANFIKWIIVKIKEFGQKGYSAKYKLYTNLSRKNRTKSADAVNINSLKWKVDSNGVKSIVTTLTKNYVNAFKGDFLHKDKMVLHKVLNFITKPFTKQDTGYKGLVNDIEHRVEEIDNARKSGMIFKGIKGMKSVGSGKANEIRAAFYDGEKPVQMTCKQLRKITGDFKILSEESMKDFAVALASAKEAQKEMATYTKELDKFAQQLKNNDANPVSVALKKATAKLCSRSLGFNSYVQSIYLEVQSTRLRYTHTAYVAMCQYLKTGGTTLSRAKESYPITADDLFSNL